MRPGSRVLVTGATGFTGSVLARKLALAGMRVSAVARPSSNTGPLDDLDIRWHRGDVFDGRVVREAAGGAEYVFHVAAAYREARHGDEFYRAVHVASTRLLAEAAAGSPGFKRFVHVSTVGVHGHIDDPPADETYRFRPGDIYQRTKAEAELWIRDFARTRGLPLAVIRPTGIYGPGDRRLFKIFRMAAGPVFPILGRGRCLYHLVHVEDLANVLMLAASHPAAEGEVFIVGNPEPIALETWARIVASHYGKKLRVLRVPAWPFFAAGALCEAVCRPLGIEPPIYRRRVAFFTKDRAFDTRKFRQRLGYAYAHPQEEGLRQTAQWYADRGWIRL
jgi:nucleoside-diphosphate-sugar epimerase